MATKQKSGLYRAKVKVGNDIAGKPVYKYISGRTKKELEQARKDVLEHYITGVGVVKDVLFSVYLQQWYDTYKKEKLSPSSKRLYGLVMNSYMVPLFGDRNLRSITATDLQSFLNTSFNGLAETLPRTAKTILHGMFKTAARDRIISEDISAYLEMPDVKPAGEKYVLSTEERAAIAELCETQPRGLMLALLYYTGLRVGEMLALRWGDIDFTSNLIHVRRGKDPTTGEISTTKTKNSVRLVPIPKPLRDLLLKQPRGLTNVYLFPGTTHESFSYSRFKTLFREMMESINLRGKVTPHTLRHNYITMCYESGIDAFTASRLAGHANIQITMNIYTHLSKQQMQTISTQVENMFTPKGCTKVAQKQ